MKRRKPNESEEEEEGKFSKPALSKKLFFLIFHISLGIVTNKLLLQKINGKQKFNFSFYSKAFNVFRIRKAVFRTRKDDYAYV